MEQKQSNRLVRYLNKLKPEQLEFVNKTIRKHLNSNVPLEEAAFYSAFSAGEKVAFYDKKNNHLTGIVQKVNQRYVKVEDLKSKKTFHVLPMRMTKVTSQTLKPDTKTSDKKAAKPNTIKMVQ